MLYPELEQKLQESKHTLNRANSENILDRCKQYLGLLADYRSKLYELREVSGVPQQTTPPALSEGTLDRTAIREALETTTRERNRTQVLLLSFTTISGYEAIEIFNERKYEGHEDWELRASGVKFRGGDDTDLMTIQEAVDLASLLRREDHIAQNSPNCGTERAVTTWSLRITRYELDQTTSNNFRLRLSPREFGVHSQRPGG